MPYGMKKTLDQLKEILLVEAEKFCETHYVFIAPFDLKACGSMRAFISNVVEDTPVSDALLAPRNDLDIYYIEHRHRLSFMRGDTVFFNRMSLGGPKG
jgi:hypothetical protein